MIFNSNKFLKVYFTLISDFKKRFFLYNYYSEDRKNGQWERAYFITTTF